MQPIWLHRILKSVPMKIQLLFLFIFLLSFSIYSQNHDYYWPMGYTTSSPDSSLGRTVIDFREAPPLVYKEDRELNFGFTMASYCDSTGNVLFYTNGLQVMGRDHEEIENGDHLNTGYYASLDYGAGYQVIQSEIFLPKPGANDTLYLFHESTDTNHIYSAAKETLHHSKLELTSNNGLGKMVIKNNPLITNGTFGSITAVKHANGMGWWIYNSINSANKYNRLLFTNKGVETIVEITFGDDIPFTTALGFIIFSPDGSRFARYEVKHGVSIFDFDRCQGSFSNPVFIPLPNSNLGGGLAISPNSRFLYVSTASRIYQFDLLAGDIEASRETVAVFDGYQSPLPTYFYKMQLGPDGRIYINCFNSASIMHVIQFPNKKGLACEVRQHGVQLPTFNCGTMPHFPNYRLGPLDGSPCDTLGLDNIPVAKYRYEQDTLDYLQVEFTDLSYYEPAEWHWDFGHGNATSQDTSPVHVFPQAGTYEVCLTVSNVNGGHTFCRTLELGTVSSSEEAQEVDITVFPNPCRDGLNVIISEYLPRDAKVVLYDAMGQRQKVQEVRTGWNTLRLDGLGAGIYFYQIWEASSPEPVSGDVLLDSGKLVKVE